MKKMLIAIAALAALSSASNAEIYKWVDENGKTHLSDKKEDIPAKKNVEEVKVSSVNKIEKRSDTDQKAMDEIEKSRNREKWKQKIKQQEYNEKRELERQKEQAEKTPIGPTDAQKQEIARERMAAKQQADINRAINHR